MRDIGLVEVERQQVALTEQAIGAEREATQAARESLALVERKLAAQRQQAASDARANEAASARLACDLTVPTEIPSTSAISAALSCSS